MTHSATPLSPADLLSRPASGAIGAGVHLHGFGGFHGGLTLALMTSAMQGSVPDIPLASATARFHRPIGDDFRVDTSVIRSGRTVSTIGARAVTAKGIHVDAQAIFGSLKPAAWRTFAPAPPVAPPPEDCEIFTIPPEFVAISPYMEIRPVGPSRPYAGGSEPELIAWIRMVEDEKPPDALRFVFLMDSLAPSYAAVLSTLALVPTVELTVRPSGNLARAESPWILLRARTRSASADGWVDEQIDAWGPDGTHLGSAQQLRVVRTD
ncbi:thioesterase family protein [Streptomyces albireticuli]|uniref:thioesterase family protein n=1 Tax=Streptomyces albireticuli TaxID=1940 RepID=UPI001F350FB6|nr:thioesterase family protein [Streptomyces albireticuli]